MIPNGFSGCSGRCKGPLEWSATPEELQKNEHLAVTAPGSLDKDTDVILSAQQFGRPWSSELV